MTEPTNKNYLNPTGFRLVLKRTPHVEYFCKAVTLPSLTLNEVPLATPLAAMNYEPGTKLGYEPLQVTFHVDEDMQNYIEIQNWMIGISGPTTSQEYVAWTRHTVINRPRENVFSDGALQILTSHKNLGKTYKFHDMFPTNLTPLDFDTTDSEIAYLFASLTLRYVSYELS